MSASTTTRSAAAPPLVQIRRAYVADCAGYQLAVELDATGWIAQVQNRADGRTLYRAQRCSLTTAQAAATEFAAWAGGALGRPEAIARHLEWRERW